MAFPIPASAVRLPRPTTAAARLAPLSSSRSAWARTAAPVSLHAIQGTSGGDEPELPFPAIPHPDYEAERPQEQTAPEPDNPLPKELPANHPREEPKGPEPEVPMPRRNEPDLSPDFPPDIVPMPGPPEAPQQPRPAEVPGNPSPPEIVPQAPSEMPQRGGSEINFP